MLDLVWECHNQSWRPEGFEFWQSALLLFIAAHFRYGEVVYFVVFVVVVVGVLLASLNRSHGFNVNIRRKQLRIEDLWLKKHENAIVQDLDATRILGACRWIISLEAIDLDWTCPIQWLSVYYCKLYSRCDAESFKSNLFVLVQTVEALSLHGFDTLEVQLDLTA